MFPVVDRGELFFRTAPASTPAASRAATPCPGWLQTYPAPEDRARPVRSAQRHGRAHQLTLTLTDRVIGVMGQPDRSLFQVGMPAAESRLVYLDRRTGKENWVASLGSIELPKDCRTTSRRLYAGCR